MAYQINQLTREIIGSAIEVHRKLGPGLLESAYRSCLCHELTLRNIQIKYAPRKRMKIYLDAKQDDDA